MTLREWVGVGLIALVGGIAGGAIVTSARTRNSAQAAPTTIAARKFVMFDSGGKRRAEWSVSDTGVAGFDVYDAAGAPRAQMGVTRDGAGIFGFFDPNKKPVAVMDAGAGGVAAMALFNSTGATRAELAMKDGDPALVLCDRGGNPILRAEVRQDQPTLGLYDSQGHWRTLVTLNSDGTPELGMADQDLKPRAMMGLQADGRATILLSANDGKPVAMLGEVGPGAASLRLYGGDGRVTGRLP